MICTLPNQREDIFFAPPPYLWDRAFLKQFPTPEPEWLDLSWRLPGGDGNTVWKLMLDIRLLSDQNVVNVRLILQYMYVRTCNVQHLIYFALVLEAF